MSVPNKDIFILKYYVLPLYSINPGLIKQEILSIYLDTLGESVFIELLSEEEYLTSNPLFKDIFTIKDKQFHVLGTDIVFKKDIKLLIQGRYSKMSQTAKTKIIHLSGLDWMKKTKDGGILCDPFLLALSKHPKYREAIEQSLNVLLGDESELIDKLTDNAFIESIIKQEL